MVLHQNCGPLDLRTVWLTVAAAAGAALLTAISLIVAKKGLSPSGADFGLAESAPLLSLVHLSLAVMDVFNAVRSLTS